MRIVTGGAFAILHRLVLELDLFHWVIVTFHAKRASGLQSQFFIVAGVRIMTTEAFPIFRRWMSGFDLLCKKIVVALVAKRFAGLDEQLLIRRFVWLMAARAIAAGYWLVLHLHPR